jgi:hypothetical protein
LNRLCVRTLRGAPRGARRELNHSYDRLQIHLRTEAHTAAAVSVASQAAAVAVASAVAAVASS